MLTNEEVKELVDQIKKKLYWVSQKNILNCSLWNLDYAIYLILIFNVQITLLSF